VQRWPNALPQYYVGHETIVSDGPRCRRAARRGAVRERLRRRGYPGEHRLGSTGRARSTRDVALQLPLNESEVVAGVDVDAGHTFADVHRVVLRIVVEGQTNVETLVHELAQRAALELVNA